MRRQDFKHGDIVIPTLRDVSRCGICDRFFVDRFDRYIDLQEAKRRSDEIMEEIMKRRHLNIIHKTTTTDDVFRSFGKDARYFLSMDGDVRLVNTHELADVFDIRYLKGGNIEFLKAEKERWIKDNNIKPDPDGCCRCYDGIETIETQSIRLIHIVF